MIKSCEENNLVREKPVTYETITPLWVIVLYLLHVYNILVITVKKTLKKERLSCLRQFWNNKIYEVYLLGD